MTSQEIRQQFIEFFREREHEIVPSSPVVPHDDPTLMFANAGMNQFKPYFLGTETAKRPRAADTQKCIRAGGKHNDLDDVGRDTYHHTFFEMLGNWSFGDYFKKEAIRWAWELLTEKWGIEKDRLHATYFEGDASEGLDPDTEARDLWLEILPPERVHPGNKKDNFWEMGDTGPCGPCSELHVDLTPDKSGASLVNGDDARVIELWNLVFIQFNRAADGRLSPLPAKHVDTGMGFERLCAILNGKKSNYDTDVFAPLFAAIQKRCSAPDYTGTLPSDSTDPSAPQVMVDVAYRVIADHVRCLTFALTDGAIPSNEGRGYVLRRILRRAVRYGRQYFGMQEPFLCDLVPAIIEQMGDSFPELTKRPDHVIELIRDEEASFGKTLTRGIQLFNDAADTAVKQHDGLISGADAFKLHDTYGFPIDLTQLMAEERDLHIDIGEYERLMEEARRQARSGTKLNPEFQHLQLKSGVAFPILETDDAPKHEGLTCAGSILGWLKDGEVISTPALGKDDTAGLILSQTSFYAEQGGQVGDVGTIKTESGVFAVESTIRVYDMLLHVGRVQSGLIKNDQPASCLVAPVRSHTMQNHTSTHVLNWALREVLGENVQQKGSLVDPEKTRFDFSHNKPVAADELRRIESLVNEQVTADHQVHTQEVDQKQALEINTLRAVFGEKYPDVVRVVSIGADIDEMLADPKNEKWMQYSVEFCGGTHLQKTAEAEDFVLIAEEAVAKGVRRLVGISGPAAKEARSKGESLLAECPSQEDVNLAERLSALQTELESAVIPITKRLEIRDLLGEVQKTIKAQSKQAATAAAGDVMTRAQELLDSAQFVGDTKIIVGEVPQANTDALRGAVDWFRQKTESSAVLLACHDGEKVTLLAGMSKDLIAKGTKAGDLIREIAPIVGGKGGGRPDMAQGGGSKPEAIGAAIEGATAWLVERIGG